MRIKTDFWMRFGPERAIKMIETEQMFILLITLFALFTGGLWVIIASAAITLMNAIFIISYYKWKRQQPITPEDDA